jgi:hypothetical protein
VKRRCAVKRLGLHRYRKWLFLKCLVREGEWLRWMAGGVVGRWVKSVLAMSHTRGRRLRLIAATQVQRSGSKAPSWKIYYEVELPSLLCDEVMVSGREVGE